MSTVTSTAPGGPAGKTTSERRMRPDVYVSYWIFAVFYGALSAGVIFMGRATPPPRPDVTDLQVAHWFSEHHATIRIGFAILLVIAGGAAISNGIIGYFMKRMSSGPVLAYAYIASMGVGAIPGFHVLLVCWLTATFRPDREPRILHLLYDLGMLSYNGSLGCFTAAYVMIAIAILYDRNRIFPKWFAYISIWQVVTEVLATQMWVFHSGAFAWNGMITFYIAVAIFGIWVGALLPIMWKAGRAETSSAPALYAREEAR